MTTIIAVNTPEETAIYFDAQCSDGDIAGTVSCKGFVIPDTCLIATAGIMYVGLLAFMQIKKLHDEGNLTALFHYEYESVPLKAREDDIKDFVALVLYEKALWTMHEEMVPVRILDTFQARGSGSHFAMGALAAQASPLEALIIASRYDTRTGPPFYRLSIDGKQTVYANTHTR